MHETDLLDRYLDDERKKPFAWGKGNGDCLLFLLGWAELNDRTASHQWRESYSDEQGARMALKAFGGAPSAVCDVMGVPRMGSEPKRGDVGLLVYEDWHVGMICTGRMWALRDGRRGISLLRRQPALVWAMGFGA